MVKDSSASVAKKHLDYGQATDDLTINRFHVTTDNNYGMQYSGQYSMHDWDGFVVPNLDMTFFLQIFFFTCGKTRNFMLFTIRERDGVEMRFDYTDNPFLQVGVQADGFFYYTIRLIGNEVDHVHHVVTDLECKHGWNYVGLYVEEIFEFSYITMYNKYSGMETTDEGWFDIDPDFDTYSHWMGTGVLYGHRKHFQVFPGYYYENEAESNDKHIVIIGCSTDRQFDAANINVDQPFGLCMEGWLQYIAMDSANDRAGDMRLDDAGHEQVKAFTEVGGVFQPVQLRTADPTVALYEDNLPTDTNVMSWDSSLPTVADPVTGWYFQEAVTDAFYQENFSCIVRHAQNGNDWTPYYQPLIGRITGNDTDHFECTLETKDLVLPPPDPPEINRRAFLGSMFFMEAWFRLDPHDLQLDGSTATIFCLEHQTDCKLGMGISNNHLRVFINDRQQDIPYDFRKDRFQWKHVGISYQRLHEMNTRLTVYIDGLQLLAVDYLTWWSYDWQAAKDGEYKFIFARNFPGIVRKAKINSQAFCGGDQIPVNTDPTKCNMNGYKTCDHCDMDEAKGDGTWECFYLCEDLGFYINDKGRCEACQGDCRYCKDTDVANSCYRCNNTKGAFRRTDLGFSTEDKNDGNTFGCSCGGAGYTGLDGDCKGCDPRCAVCNHEFNFDCAQCNDGAYMVAPRRCEYECPEGYIPDERRHACVFPDKFYGDMILPQDPQGCVDGWYWDWEDSKCYKCDSPCETCEFDEDRCTTCEMGRYLTRQHTCDICNDIFSTRVETGATNVCYEGCGDGLNFGVNVCDDGNLENGDGCNDQCKVEKDWYCRGGYQTQTYDVCNYIPTELESVLVNERNDLMLRFTRPVSTLYEKRYLTEEDFKITLVSRDGVNKTVEWKSYLFPQPCSYIFLELNIEEWIEAGFEFDQVLTVELLDSGVFYDENRFTVKGSVHSALKAHLYKQYPMPKEVEAYTRWWAQLGIILFWIAISLQVTWAWIARRSAMPAIIVFISGQVFFYTSCQDLHLDGQMHYFFSFFRFFRLEHPFPPNVFYHTGLIDFGEVGRSLYHENMVVIADYLYNNFYVNNCVKFYLWGLFFFFMPIIAFIDFSCTSMTESNLKTRQYYHNQIFSRYFFSFTLLLINFSFYPFGLTAFMEIIELRLITRYDVQSYIFSCLVFLVCLIFLATLWSMPIYHWRRKNHPLFAYRFAILFWAFKPTLWAQLFTPLYATRRFIHLLMVGWFQHSSFVPNGVQILIGATFLVYVIVVRPFKAGLATLTMVLMELLVMVNQFFLLPFYTILRTNDKVIAKDVIFRLAPYILAVIIGLMIIMLWWRALDFFYKRRFGKRRNTYIHKLEYRYHRWLYPKKAIEDKNILETLTTLGSEIDTKPALKTDKQLEKLVNMSGKTFKTEAAPKKEEDLVDGMFDVNKVRKDNRDDERFDDKMLYREAPFSKGFPEVESNNKYIVKRYVEKANKVTAQLVIDEIGDVTYNATERVKKVKEKEGMEADPNDKDEGVNASRLEQETAKKKAADKAKAKAKDAESEIEEVQSLDVASEKNSELL